MKLKEPSPGQGTPDFRAFFRAAPGLFLVLAPDFKIVAVSDDYLRATMTQREQILGKGIFEVFPDNPKDPAATGVHNLRISLERVLKNRVPDTMDTQKYDIRKPEADGGGFEERHWNLYSVPVFGPDEKVAYIIHRIEDVTEFVHLKLERSEQQKHTEELRAQAKQLETQARLSDCEAREVARQLEEANKQSASFAAHGARAREDLDSFFNVSPDMLCIAGTDGFFKRLNPAWESKLGYTCEELMAEPFVDFMHPDDRQASIQEVEKLTGIWQTVDFENRFRCKDGSYRRLSWNAASRPEQQLIYAVGRDVTELRQTEQALRRSEERFRLMAENIVDYAILMLDTDGRVTTWNPGAERIKGYSAEEIVGQHFSRFFPLADIEAGKPEYELKVAAQVGRFLDEGWRVRKDGSTFWATVVITALRDEHGTLLGFAKLTRDMTQHKMAQDALVRAKETAEQSNKFKDQFLSTMSHELRTPLNAVLGFSDLLNEERYGPLNDRQRRYVGHIHSGGKHLLRLINDILDLSKIEAGRLHLAIENVSVNACMSEAVDCLRPLSDKKCQTMLVKPSADLSVRADSMRFKQILMNLLGNAVKFTPDGGKIELSAQQAGDVVRVAVQDSGPGIPPEEQKLIFEAFYRLRQTGKAAEGTGLGLAITQRLVELQGGSLGLESQPGAGSRFFFTLPLVPTFEPENAGKAESKLHCGERPCILVIEDNFGAAHVIQAHLTSAGYDVVLCERPERALELATETKPSAITLDVIMKPVSGWEILAKLKSDPRTAAIPVIIVTVVDQPSTGALLGADEYIIKPVDKPRLLSAIERCLNKRGPLARARPILIVEDDTPTREFLAELLFQKGYTVVTAADGAEARAAVAASPPELVILDLILPKVSGFELLAEWRASSSTLELPVFVLTSKDLSPQEKDYIRTKSGMLFQKQEPWQDAMIRELQRAVSPVLAGKS
jgi:PAS domain S-box-containing protein